MTLEELTAQRDALLTARFISHSRCADLAINRDQLCGPRALQLQDAQEQCQTHGVRDDDDDIDLQKL
jgi:hypothetical protein